MAVGEHLNTATGVALGKAQATKAGEDVGYVDHNTDRPGRELVAQYASVVCGG